jgi:hypothetical protein
VSFVATSVTPFVSYREEGFALTVAAPAGLDLRGLLTEGTHLIGGELPAAACRGRKMYDKVGSGQRIN